MELKHLSEDLFDCPAEFHALFSGAPVYDSSCSESRTVYFIDKGSGYFLKSGPKGSLEFEAQMTRYFYKQGMAAPVLSYISRDKDYLLTEKLAGADCTSQSYLSEPERLCEKYAEILRNLHTLDLDVSILPSHTEKYLARARANMRRNQFEADLFTEEWRLSDAKEAWNLIASQKHLLKCDTLLHGDYCLPNVILNNWRFSGFVDLDNAGLGDRHVDVFWAIWTLKFNLKTDRYRERFLDAYGRGQINEELLRVVAALECFG